MNLRPGRSPILRPAISVFVLLAALTGIVYPLAVTGVAQVLFPTQANGSLLSQDGKIVGSELIGQNFSDPKNFWGRLSATAPMPYNAAASSGSNFGPLNPALTEAAKVRLDRLKAADPENALPVPVDLVTASASGLDPHISAAAAYYQAARVARLRGVPLAHVEALIAQRVETPLWGVLGEPRVNVLKLNLALARLDA
ncbi:MAG: potassium-transporting ATPase subunit C [Candidatus Accumulibacter sp. 66-26]|nr:potassium-transporting ATPase subunit KdpC [Accumulibacter sp.]OJW48999.1 MAG: potassium-transporting ATPase subunit C [Candidatus Accumulibacter sp. 66-26]